jgi:hypothetical protein
MAQRIITDSAGRVWTCTSDPVAAGTESATLGRDVTLACATPSIAAPVRVTVGWRWETMPAPGLGRILTLASAVPKY